MIVENVTEDLVQIPVAPHLARIPVAPHLALVGAQAQVVPHTLGNSL